jgi:intracellular septation protein
MKFLFDFLPILLFFGAFKYAENNAQWAANFTTEYLGFLISGGVVSTTEAPVLISTGVVILATLLQVAWLLARGKKVDTMLWVSLALVVLLGGATIWFHSDTFIKWKPSVLYWVMGLSFWVAPRFFGKNLLQMMLQDVRLPKQVWNHLSLSWMVFFVLMGVLNLYIAYHFSTPAWVNFKVFGSLGLVLVFTIAQGVYMSKHLLPDEEANNQIKP